MLMAIVACLNKRKFSISKWVAQNALMKAPDTQSVRCGRVRKTTPGDNRLLKVMITGSPDVFSFRIAKTVRMFRINVSSRTVRRRLE